MLLLKYGLVGNSQFAIWKFLDVHSFTTVYTPQQNSVSKRKNGTIVEMARCMLQAKNLFNGFGGEVVNTVLYLLN